MLSTTSSIVKTCFGAQDSPLYVMISTDGVFNRTTIGFHITMHEALLRILYKREIMDTKTAVNSRDVKDKLRLNMFSRANIAPKSN